MCETNFKPIDRSQLGFYQHDLKKFIPEDDLVFLVIEVVEKLDIEPMLRNYSQLGQNPYHPKMMLTILFYAYANGVFSSRKIEERLKYDIRFMYIASMYRISFNRINEFRKENIQHIKDYFAQIVRICVELKMALVQFVSIDGTKLQAAASNKQLVDKEQLIGKIELNQQDIDALIARIEAINEQEELSFAHPDDPAALKENLDRLNDRKDKLTDALEKLDENPRQRRINLTEPECREQKRIGSGYNAQAAVDADSQIILAVDVTSDPNDVAQFISLVDQVEVNTDSVGQAKTVAADSGYASGRTFTELETRGHIDAYIPTREQVHRGGEPKPLFDKANFAFDLASESCVCPMGHPMQRRSRHIRRGVNNVLFMGTCCSSCPAKSLCTKALYRQVRMTAADDLVKAMESKMSSDAGRDAMRIRRETVEPVFGQIKGNFSFRRFYLRGLDGVRGEFTFLCCAFNLRKMHKYLNGNGIAGVLSSEMAKSVVLNLVFCFFFAFSPVRRKS